MLLTYVFPWLSSYNGVAHVPWAQRGDKGYPAQFHYLCSNKKARGNPQLDIRVAVIGPKGHRGSKKPPQEGDSIKFIDLVFFFVEHTRFFHVRV
jgi:hypothetical protein